MTMHDTPNIDAAMQTAYAVARELVPAPAPIVIVALHDDDIVTAIGDQAIVDSLSLHPLGLADQAARWVHQGRISEAAIEQAIADIEDVVMPLRSALPPSAQLFSADADFLILARYAGMPVDARTWFLSTDVLEQLFNRWIARSQGRPASQDDLPVTARFGIAILVLRECLHHLGFAGVTLLNSFDACSPLTAAARNRSSD